MAIFVRKNQAIGETDSESVSALHEVQIVDILIGRFVMIGTDPHDRVTPQQESGCHRKHELYVHAFSTYVVRLKQRKGDRWIEIDYGIIGRDEPLGGLVFENFKPDGVDDCASTLGEIGHREDRSVWIDTNDQMFI